MYKIDLSNKTAVVFGVANDRSIGWSIAQTLAQAGARLAILYQNERLKSRISTLVKDLPDAAIIECDVSSDTSITSAFEQISSIFGRIDILVHSIAYAQREDLGGAFSDTNRDGFKIALDISAYSLIPLVREGSKLMESGGAVVTLTFDGSSKVYPGYNIMGTAKAALENEVRQLSSEYGIHGIRVNAISAGPLNTLAARGINGFAEMKRIHAEKSPLKRNIKHSEIGDAALFLLSDMSSGITGTILQVDAGYHIMAV